MKLNTLQDLYIHELKDLYSAEKQILKALPRMAKAATSPKLKAAFEAHLTETKEHVTRLEQVLALSGAGTRGPKCKGMEGLVAEAIKHTIEDAPVSGPVLDAAIIAQHQRMTHYGITGFGTVSAFAKALQLDDDQTKLQSAVKEMYQADELMTELAESAVNIQAA